jgi:hypothetical protein
MAPVSTRPQNLQNTINVQLWACLEHLHQQRYD